MTRKLNTLDDIIIKKLQDNGLIKSEAEAYLKRNVYKLDRHEVDTIKNYSEHFGLSGKERIIDDILELRREALITKLASRTAEVLEN
ncbi:hypothetical protein L1D15_03060 [Vibrio sp. Isolate25]|uniref:hypothetical protein n=1 Tax=Vibrio TaxID=662 RepID=UPI001EFDF2F9|nr:MULTISPECIES: hypothetical protein [Vibrio]MCG9595698.1 hypothetical protein [Vibrio sp. Isolate25]MCG9677194.1 hypothetical protein [Vibrio sp. Isolate24]USD34160.1 hypothetical protein J8Z27_19150 [Vibrio sp. SCSIO 43186]USD47231.1 hypothetical protein J4N38_19550 [Vibrio sp. SCSIO 43145]USD71284.1 hypothetical protein J4N41_19160 [Vibrio sp. SCSIO 43139]